MSFTPGPWQAHGIYVFGGGVTTVAKAPYADVSLAQAKANARLIAASPTMFEYIVRRASEGDSEAAAIVREVSDASRS